jgi:hypothetical protein
VHAQNWGAKNVYFELGGASIASFNYDMRFTKIKMALEVELVLVVLKLITKELYLYQLIELFIWKRRQKLF